MWQNQVEYRLINESEAYNGTVEDDKKQMVKRIFILFLFFMYKVFPHLCQEHFIWNLNSLAFPFRPLSSQVF